MTTVRPFGRATPVRAGLLPTSWVAVVLVALAAGVHAAPNVTNSTQKGSLLIYPDIDVRGTVSTLVRLANDGASAVDVKCYWMDGNKNRSDFVVTLTKGQAIWIDAKSGQGTYRVNPFPPFPSNGYDNPYLGGATRDPYLAGTLVCFAIDPVEQNQIKWNHLSGTATVYDTVAGTAYEYTAFGFFVQSGIDAFPVGTPGVLYLNGVDYDSCPLYAIGQMSPEGTIVRPGIATITFERNRLAVAGCTLALNQDWVPVYTKLLFDVWNADEVKFSGGFECADSWHETLFTDIDAAAANFTRVNLGTDSTRYRVQGVKSTQCNNSQAIGLLAVQSTTLSIDGRVARAGTSLTAAGKFLGRIAWDPASVVPEATR
jgi:hypothetical protein